MTKRSRKRDPKRAKSKKLPERKPVLIVVTGQTEEKYFNDRKRDKKYSSTIIEIENSHGDANPLKPEFNTSKPANA